MSCLWCLWTLRPSIGNWTKLPCHKFGNSQCIFVVFVCVCAVCSGCSVNFGLLLNVTNCVHASNRSNKETTHQKNIFRIIIVHYTLLVEVLFAGFQYHIQYSLLTLKLFIRMLFTHLYFYAIRTNKSLATIHQWCGDCMASAVWLVSLLHQEMLFLSIWRKSVRLCRGFISFLHFFLFSLSHSHSHSLDSSNLFPLLSSFPSHTFLFVSLSLAHFSLKKQFSPFFQILNTK